MKYIVISTLILFAMTPDSRAGGDPNKGRLYYNTCATCHGKQGGGDIKQDAPKIAGLPEWYLVRQITNFKQGIRGTDPRDAYGAQMIPYMRTLATRQSVMDVAAYISRLKAPGEKPVVEGDAANGKKHYETLCKSCHGANGEGDETQNAPELRDRSDWYLGRQLMNFRDGVRGVHPKDVHGAQMRASALTLPDYRALQDVIAYIATLRE